MFREWGKMKGKRRKGSERSEEETKEGEPKGSTTIAKRNSSFGKKSKIWKEIVLKEKERDCNQSKEGGK